MEPCSSSREQEGYAVLGQVNGEVLVAPGHFLRLYRQEYDTPYISKNDNRMTPNTFEGYSFQGAFGGKEGAPELRYGGGYVTKIKERNSDKFVWMSRDAGADVERGVALSRGALLAGSLLHRRD